MDDKPSFHHPFTIISYRVGDFSLCLSNWIISPPPTFSFSLKMKKKCLKTSPASNNFTKKPTFKIFSAKGADPWHFCEMHFPSQPSTRRYENSLHLALVFDFPLPNFWPLSLEGRKPGFNVVDFWEEGMKGE